MSKVIQFQRGSASQYYDDEEEQLLRIEALEYEVVELRSLIETRLNPVPVRPYLTIKEAIAEILPVSEKSLRWFIWYNTFGFRDRVVIKRGSRVYLDREELIRWMEEGGANFTFKRRQKGNS